MKPYSKTPNWLKRATDIANSMDLGIDMNASYEITKSRMQEREKDINHRWSGHPVWDKLSADTKSVMALAVDAVGGTQQTRDLFSLVQDWKREPNLTNKIEKQKEFAGRAASLVGRKPKSEQQRIDFAGLVWNIANDRWGGHDTGKQWARQNVNSFAAETNQVDAERLRQMGRNGDTILAHISPAEAEFLHRTTDGGSINPDTGLPEFFDLSGLFAQNKQNPKVAEVNDPEPPIVTVSQTAESENDKNMWPGDELIVDPNPSNDENVPDEEDDGDVWPGDELTDDPNPPENVDVQVDCASKWPKGFNQLSVNNKGKYFFRNTATVDFKGNALMGQDSLLYKAYVIPLDENCALTKDAASVKPRHYQAASTWGSRQYNVVNYAGSGKYGSVLFLEVSAKPTLNDTSSGPYFIVKVDQS